MTEQPEWWRHDEVHSDEERAKNRVGHTWTIRDKNFARESFRAATTVQVFIPEADPEMWGLVRLVVLAPTERPPTQSREPGSS